MVTRFLELFSKWEGSALEMVSGTESWGSHLLLLQRRSSRGCHGPVDGPPSQPARLHHHRNMAGVSSFTVQKLCCKLMRPADVMSRSTCVYGLSWREEVEQCKPVSLYGGGGRVVYPTTALGEEVSLKFPDLRRLSALTRSIQGSAATNRLCVQQRQLDTKERNVDKTWRRQTVLTRWTSSQLKFRPCRLLIK